MMIEIVAKEMNSVDMSYSDFTIGCYQLGFRWLLNVRSSSATITKSGIFIPTQAAPDSMHQNPMRLFHYSLTLDTQYLDAAAVHQCTASAELHALAAHKDLQGAVERLLAVVLALDEFAAQCRQGGGIADW